MEFIELGFMSIVTSVDTKLIDKGYIGKLFDKNFVKMLLTLGIDPCGENGEFHSFTYQGPIFQYPININALNKQ
jgi:diphthamide synthase (EF-2-diphthine--ammonia ligase)